ncbi:hypothetical protein V2S66_00045 [Streptomyces sp. V4-01]|uniref:Uncharacterized protein n=1 Tax=Actinacidiphila polyblastidii TaxID=3110430 RepID=A0ABU7P3J8_9ACTN|nr:hypothetical protein [Streptomyces sp. V4-01]
MIALHILAFTGVMLGPAYALALPALVAVALGSSTGSRRRRRLITTARTLRWGGPVLAVSSAVQAAYQDLTAGMSLAGQCVAISSAVSALLCVGYVTVRVVARRATRLARNAVAPRLVAVAAAIAGERRDLRDVWTADLAGDPEAGAVLSARQRLVMAAGFVVAACRMRASDAAAPVWSGVDWLVSREQRTNALITVSCTALAVYFARTDGVHALLTADWQSCAGLGGGLFVLARWVRRIRGIELAERERRRGRG